MRRRPKFQVKKFGHPDVKDDGRTTSPETVVVRPPFERSYEYIRLGMQIS